MGNLITIFKGDEHRAKIEKEYNKGDFFDDVYLRAHKAFQRIIEESDEYVKENKSCGYRIKYQGMGNNIIMFTSGRGQGKTSAMQSFAEFLRNADSGRGVLQKIENRYFMVLDAIDPTSLDKKENLIRVLLSRLFLMLERPQSCGKSGRQDCQQDCRMDCCRRADDRQKREALLKLFRDCYDSIEVLREERGKDKEYLQDDLEHLAQIGNSARLKENLHNLVENLLEYITPEGKYAKDSMLVVQIDDADLSSANVFEICEDVHHYLSIPNVIVLMAADYDQLRYCLSERYLRQHKELQDERSGVDVFDKSREMAVRYLEKVFPDRHRIDLPVLNELTVYDYGKLEIIYRDKSKEKDKEKDKVYPEKIYDYLLKRIYYKTGIILLNTKNMLHPLLPHTLRELTHFLNLLEEIPEINFQRVCSNIYSESLSEECSKEIGNLKNNLQRLKQYFLNDWCPNNLSENQLNLIRSIEKCERDRKLAMSVRLLNRYLEDEGEDPLDVEKEETYHRVMMALERCSGLQQHVKLQSALFFYYSLFLNEWFADAMDSPGELSSFAEFIQSAVYWKKSVSIDKSTEYVINQVDFSLVKLREFLRGRGKTLLTAAGSYWLDSFTNINGNDVTPPEAHTGKTDRVNSAYRWFTAARVKHPDMTRARFDVFRAPISILLNADLKDKAEKMAEEVSLSAIMNQDGDLTADRDRQFDIYVSIKNIVTNVEVQQSIERQADRLGRSRIKGAGWFLEVDTVCDELDKWMNKTVYQKIVPQGLGYTTRMLLNNNAKLNNNELLFALLLCNSENREKYCAEYRKCIRQKNERILEHLEAIRKLTYNSKKGDTILAEDAKIPRLGDDDWEDMYPKAFGDPAGIEMSDIEQLNEYREAIRHNYGIINDIRMTYIEELQQNEARKEGNSSQMLRAEIEKVKKELLEINSYCEETSNASNKRKS